MMVVSIFFTVLLTVICSFGNGIHDIGLIGFPIIIGFSSIILDQRQLIISSTLSILGLSWLVIGAQFELFEPIPVPAGNAGDFIIASLMILLGGFVAFSLTSNMKNSLKHVQREIAISKKDANILFREMEEKEEIISEIHTAVINSLSHIQQLVAYKKTEKNDLFDETYNSLKRKIIVIEIAHNILLKTNAPIYLDLMELARQTIDAYEKHLQTKVLRVDISKETCFTSLDQAINFGICLLELVYELDSEGIDSLNISLTIQDDNILLQFTGFEELKHPELGIVMDLLTKQLKGDLQKSSSKVSLIFKPKPMK